MINELQRYFNISTSHYSHRELPFKFLNLCSRKRELPFKFLNPRSRKRELQF